MEYTCMQFNFCSFNDKKRIFWLRNWWVVSNIQKNRNKLGNFNKDIMWKETQLVWHFHIISVKLTLINLSNSKGLGFFPQKGLRRTCSSNSNAFFNLETCKYLQEWFNLASLYSLLTEFSTCQSYFVIIFQPWKYFKSNFAAHRPKSIERWRFLKFYRKWWQFVEICIKWIPRK